MFFVVVLVVFCGLLCFVVLCFVVFCCVLFCFVLLCCIVLCCVVLCSSVLAVCMAFCYRFFCARVTHVVRFDVALCWCCAAFFANCGAPWPVSVTQTCSSVGCRLDCHLLLTHTCKLQVRGRDSFGRGGASPPWIHGHLHHRPQPGERRKTC